LLKPGLDRYPASKGISDNWCRVRDALVRKWPANKPPKPDWDQYDDENILVQDDMPAEPGPDDVVLELDDFETLELTDHQKVMLLPVDTRIQNIVYPASIQARVQAISKHGKNKKSQWNAKFKGHFMGKNASKWKDKVNKAMGIKKSAKDALKELGPAVVIKTRKKVKKAPGPKIGSKNKAKPTTVSQVQTQELIENHPDLKKSMTVTSEAAGEKLQGMRGNVVTVYQVREANGSEWIKYLIMQDTIKANPVRRSAQQGRGGEGGLPL
jgi:hypothetical protein